MMPGLISCAKVAMRKRRLVYLAILLSIALGGYFVLYSDDRITQEHYARIKPGMTVQEVDQILGGPEGVYVSLWNSHGSYPAPPPPKADGVKEQEWIGAAGAIWVYFDGNRCVVESHFVEVKFSRSRLDFFCTIGKRWVTIRLSGFGL